MFKFLHTSDWHLGQNFMGQSRKSEHEAFLTWLLRVIQEESIDLLIVAGDIFDTTTPPNYALELYYNFLTNIARSGCQNIIIIAGNHDSIATLKAPKQLLEALHVHVIVSGDITENELIPVTRNDELLALVCAVPFLRDYVVRQSLPSETLREKEMALVQGIQAHYEKIYEDALLLRETKDIPIIATGHLTLLGSQTSDSEREIYIGTTFALSADFLAEKFDYVALGHLHRNQYVGDFKHVCYSGSPIALSFSEANAHKQVNIVTFDNTTLLRVEHRTIPQLRDLVRLRGDMQMVEEALKNINNAQTWVEVQLNDLNPFVANQHIRQLANRLGVKLLAVKIENKDLQDAKVAFSGVALDEMSVFDLFEKRLAQEDIHDETLREALKEHFKIVVDEVQHR